MDAAAMADTVHLTLDEVQALALTVLGHHGVCEAQAQAMARVMLAGERDECHSHGLFRLLMCVESLRGGRVVRDAQPQVEHRSMAVVAVDAQCGFSPLAFEVGSAHLVEKVRHSGIAALVINRCFHFSALWPEVEHLTRQGLCALVMTPSHACVAPAGGRLPVFGTNPIAFGWPRGEGDPYVFDFATSAIARGEIDLYRRSGRTLPEGWGIDEHGHPSTDAATVLQRGAMLTFGGYKGSALSTMIELLAGPLLGDLTSQESLALDGRLGGAPQHGELILAFDPCFFSRRDADADQASAERLFQAIAGQGARLPSQRRFEARARSLARGVFVARALHQDILSLMA
jgi:LDH2 family malate/lactate/ureidoglycolate dehydrogenase